MHKAYRAVSMRVEMMAFELQEGGDLDPFGQASGFWGKQLPYHATAEDEYMTAPQKNSKSARDNEAEHAGLGEQARELVAFMKRGDTAGLEQTVAVLLAFEEEQHQELERLRT